MEQFREILIFDSRGEKFNNKKYLAILMARTETKIAQIFVEEEITIR
jgi:hypothetical protein